MIQKQTHWIKVEIPRMATINSTNIASETIDIVHNNGGYDKWCSIQPNNLQINGSSYLYNGDYYGKAPDGDLIEFKLTDGTKIIKEVIWGRIENIVEKINAEKNNQKYVMLDYKEKDGSVKTYEIDCNLSMFMKLIGKEYKSWNQMMMTESVKNGKKVN